MQIKPTWYFDNTNETGIDKVPTNAKIVILDSDGSGTPMELVKISNLNITSTSTLSDFLADGTLFKSTSSSSASTDDIIDGGTY